MCGSDPCEKPNCTWSESFRAKCEAKHLAGMGEIEREAQYARVLKHRGQVEVNRIKRNIEKLKNGKAH